MSTTSFPMLLVLAGATWLLASATAQQPDKAPVFRDFAQVQRLRVVCSQQHFGRVEDLVAEVPGGRITAAVVTLTVGQKTRTVLVPFADLTYEPTANLLQLANCLDKGARYAAFDPAAVRVVAPPDGEEDGVPTGTVLVSRLQRSEVRLQDGSTGSAQGLTLELRSGHVAFLDVAAGKERAGDADLHPVPFAALRFVDGGADAAKAPVVALAKPAADLRASPNLVEVIVSDPLYRGKLYGCYGVAPPVFDRS